MKVLDKIEDSYFIQQQAKDIAKRVSLEGYKEYSLEELEELHQQYQDQQIVLRARFDGTRPVIVRPVLSQSNNKLLTGQKYMSELQKQAHPHVVTFETKRTLKDGTILFLDDFTTFIDWICWLRFHPYLRATKEEALKDKSVLFYVEDAVKESKEHVDKKELEAELIVAIKAMTDSEMNDFIRIYFGINMSGYATEQKKEKLQQEASTNPIKMKELMDNKKKVKMLVFLYNAIDHPEIEMRQEDNLSFYYRGTLIGLTESEAIAWLEHKDNSEPVSWMRAKLNPKPKEVKV